MIRNLILAFSLLPFILSGQVPNTFSDSEKIYGLSTIWKEAEFNFAYFEKIGTVKWDSLYKSMINRVLETKNDYEYYRELSFFMSFLKDGHTGVGRYPNVDRYTTIYKGYLIEFGRIGEKVIVTRINYSKKDSIPLGSELLEVNGLAPDNYLAKFVTPYISASTDKSRDEKAVYNILDGLPGMKYTIKIKTPANDIKTIQLVHGDIGEKFPPATIPETVKREAVEFKWFDNKIAYLAINSFSDSTILASFTKLLPEIAKADKLIIDIRENTGGNSEIGFEILKYLTDDKILNIHSSKTRKHIPRANREEAFVCVADSYEPYVNNHTDKSIVIPTLVLTGGKTISAAEDFLVPIKKIGHMRTMGETTSGSTGSPYSFKLPGSWAYVCSLQCCYPDGSEYVGVGIKPDIEVKRTIRGIINRKDEVLDQALADLNGRSSKKFKAL